MPIRKSNKRKRREKHIPTPVKVYLRQFLGEDVLNKPLTEKYFQPEELKAINLLIEESRSRTSKSKRVATPSIKETRSRGNLGFKVPTSYASIPTYTPTGGVTYDDYDKVANYLRYRGGARPAKAIKQFSAEDPIIPYQSVQHTLGNFAYEEVKDPDTGKVSYKVTDVYDWDPIYDAYGQNPELERKGRYPKWSDLPNIITGRPEPTKIGERTEERYNLPVRLTNLAEWAGAKFGPRATKGEGIKFDIDIPQREYDFDHDYVDEILAQRPSKKRPSSKGGILKHTKKHKKKTNNKIISGKIMVGYKAGGKV